MKKRRVKPAGRYDKPGYPERPAQPVDASRRRFLKQVTVGTTGIGVMGVAASVGAQPTDGLDVDFSILAEHDSLEPAALEIAEGRRRARGQAPVVEADELARSEDSGSEELADPDPSEPDPSDSSDPLNPDSELTADPLVVLLTENRALWVDPAYLVMVQWDRPEDDESPIAALEGAAVAVGEFLEASSVDMDLLHDVERLHAVEAGVLELLNATVAPASITVLHLDHDCAIVCDQMEETIHVRGRMATPGTY